MGIYASWVAHEGSFAARQVFLNERQDIALLLSGECFLDPEIRAALGRNGHADRRATGNWMVHLYEEEGDQFFEKLNGLFSGLLIDKRQNKAFLFNDRYGLERIYWHQERDALYFASEAKALLRVLPKLREFDSGAVAQFLAFGCTMGEQTLFKGVNVLPGATCWRFERHGAHSKARYFHPKEWEAQEPLTEQQFEAEFSGTFERILPRYAEDNKTVGISLTGGLDTRMVMACLPKTNTTHTCYTFVGLKGLTLDARLAAKIAAVRDLEHRVIRIEPDFLRDFGTHFDRTVYVTDGCAGAISSHEIYFNAQARHISPVRLTGNFGSEVLRSVSTFKPLWLQSRLLSESYEKVVTAQMHRGLGRSAHPVTFSAFCEIPWSLFGLVAAGRSQVTFRTPYLDNDLVALAYRAPATLRRSPVPALHLIKLANARLARIPTDRGELLGSSGLDRALRRVFGEATFKIDYYHKEGLPTLLSAFDPLLNSLSPIGILGRHKFLPYCHWFRKELASTIMERLSSRRVRQAPWWSKTVPETLARTHILGRGNYLRELNAVLSLEAIDRLFFEEISTEPLRRDVIELETCTTENGVPASPRPAGSNPASRGPGRLESEDSFGSDALR